MDSKYLFLGLVLLHFLKFTTRIDLVVGKGVRKSTLLNYLLL